MKKRRIDISTKKLASNRCPNKGNCSFCRRGRIVNYIDHSKEERVYICSYCKRESRRVPLNTYFEDGNDKEVQFNNPLTDCPFCHNLSVKIYFNCLRHLFFRYCSNCQQKTEILNRDLTTKEQLEKKQLPKIEIPEVLKAPIFDLISEEMSGVLRKKCIEYSKMHHKWKGKHPLSSYPFTTDKEELEQRKNAEGHCQGRISYYQKMDSPEFEEMNPIVVTSTGRLVDGDHRILANASWKMIIIDPIRDYVLCPRCMIGMCLVIEDPFRLKCANCGLEIIIGDDRVNAELRNIKRHKIKESNILA